MSNWRVVLQLEWRILRRDRAALSVLGIFASFLIIAAIAGGQHAKSVTDGLDKSQKAQDTRLEALKNQLNRLDGSSRPLGSKDPRNTVWMGKEGAALMAVLPPSPLASIAVGQRDLHPQAVRVTSAINLIRERKTETPMAGPTRLRTGAFDPAFIFVVLFPLVIIALSYELLSGERERGTLAMLLSQPVSQSSLVLGKASARLGLLTATTAFFALLGLLIGGGHFQSQSAILHSGLYCAILIVWSLFWFAAAIAVNSRGGTSAKNALVLVGLWLIIVVVVPGLINVGVDSLYPAPSRIELLHEAREAAQAVEGKLTGMVGRHDVNPEKGELAKKVVLVEQELASRSEPILQELNEALNRRQELLNGLRFISPAILVQFALEDVAGSGAIRHQRFQEQADTFHQTYRDFFATRIQTQAPLSPKDLATLPQFTFVEEPTTKLLSRIGSALLALLLAALALLLYARPGLKKIGRLSR